MPTFLLGVGAQKAGTTWLHRYLRAAPGFAAGAMKEYHVWDAVYATDEEGAPRLEGGDTAAREALRQQLIADPELYFDHFADLLAEPGKSFAADITPAYSALPAEALRRIRNGLEARGLGFKILFLMRDPVERCWSAARMYRRKGLKVAGLDPEMGEAEFVLAYAATPHAQRRGRYERTVAAIEAAVASGDYLFGFYETLFAPETGQAISDFLRVALQPGFAAREFNVSPKSEQLPDEVRREVARIHRDTLLFCGERFPEIRDLWSSYSLIC